MLVIFFAPSIIVAVYSFFYPQSVFVFAMSRYPLFFAFCLALLLSPLASFGVVITGVGGDTINTTAPLVDDFGFARVGNMNAKTGSGVYLQDGWVLTANHVGAGDIVFSGTTYTYDTGTATQRIGSTDLLLFKILSPPSMTDTVISSTRPTGGSEVYMMGFGKGREAAPTTWNASWVEGGLPTAYTGYNWNTAQEVGRWGNNQVTGNSNVTVLGTDEMTITFDQVGSLYEAMGSTGDSGGGVFYKNGSTWELAGIMSAIGTIGGQPSNTSVFTNVTYAADLSVYRDSIVAIIPEPRYVALWLGLFVGVVLLLKRRFI